MDNSSFPSSDRSGTGSAGSTTSGMGSGSPGSSTGSGLSGSTYSSTGSGASSSGMGTGSMGGSGSGGVGGGFEARESVDRAQGAAHSTVDRLANTARGWAEKIDERARGMSDVPVRAWDYSRNTVQEHPMQAVLLSLLVGYVIGRFSGGRTTHYVEY